MGGSGPPALPGPRCLTDACGLALPLPWCGVCNLSLSLTARAGAYGSSARVGKGVERGEGEKGRREKGRREGEERRGGEK